jgi:hypothetical protein
MNPVVTEESILALLHDRLEAHGGSWTLVLVLKLLAPPELAFVAARTHRVKLEALRIWIQQTPSLQLASSTVVRLTTVRKAPAVQEINLVDFLTSRLVHHRQLLLDNFLSYLSPAEVKCIQQVSKGWLIKWLSKWPQFQVKNKHISLTPAHSVIQVPKATMPTAVATTQTLPAPIRPASVLPPAPVALSPLILNTPSAVRLPQLIDSSASLLVFQSYLTRFQNEGRPRVIALDIEDHDNLR